MTIEVPRYDNGVKHFSNETYRREVNEEDYFKSVDDFKVYLDKGMYTKIEEYTELEISIRKAVDTNKIVSFIAEDLKRKTDFLTNTLDEMPDHIMEEWADKLLPLQKILKTNASNNSKFLKNNLHDVNAVLYECICKLQKQKQEAIKNAKKKYYEKQKALCNTVPKPEKTEEERKASAQLAKHKYYEKQKALRDTEPKPKMTEEERKESAKLAKHKYYEKQKALRDTEPKPKQTEEEVKESRKTANQKYYKSKKELQTLVDKYIADGIIPQT
jgi:hypothetical protein